MSLRSGHGNGAGVPRVEVLSADELPAGVAALNRPREPEIRRDANGRPADAESHRALSALGGKARAGKSRLARRVALGDTFADPRFERYAGAAKAFRRLHVRRLAQCVGGGECGPAPSSIIASAALQLAASRFAFEVLGEVQLGSRLANDSRQNLLAAHELCAREAEARVKSAPAPAWWSIGGSDGPAGEPSALTAHPSTDGAQTLSARPSAASSDNDTETTSGGAPNHKGRTKSCDEL